MEVVVTDIDTELECIGVSTSATAGNDLLWIGAEGPWVSGENPYHLRKELDFVKNELISLSTFIGMLNKLEEKEISEKEFLEWTETLDEHPEEYSGICFCNLCKSYAD
jgi:hypothetical protein